MRPANSTTFFHLAVSALIMSPKAVGDWINDVPMFMAAGRSFVMGQAPEEVKNVATDVLEETVETGGGIARVVRDVFGISF